LCTTAIREERQHGLAHGAFSYLVKPATTGELEAVFVKLKAFAAPHTKKLLVIEDNDRERASIVELLAHEDIEVTAVATGAEALAALREAAFDCCVVDLRLPDMTGFELLETLRAAPAIGSECTMLSVSSSSTTSSETSMRWRRSWMIRAIGCCAPTMPTRRSGYCWTTTSRRSYSTSRCPGSAASSWRS